MTIVFTGKTPEKHDIDARAAHWAILKSEGTLDDRQQLELDEWLASDPRHLGALVRAEAAWLDLDRIAALEAGARVPRERSHIDRIDRQYWLRGALAASLALVVASGFFAWDRLSGRIETERGEVRQVALEDGSTATLNGDSVVQVRYRDDERRLVLRRGEASFSVARDATRPFTVRARDVSATAIGTEFVVGMEGDDIAVTVREGVVEVRADGPGGEPRRQQLRDNEQFVAAATGPRRATLDPAELERRLAWREGLLIFDGQQLGAAAREVNRYAERPVVIGDPTLARAEFIGVFHLGDSRSFANAAATAFNGRVIERDGEYHLVRRQNSPSH